MGVPIVDFDDMKTWSLKLVHFLNQPKDLELQQDAIRGARKFEEYVNKVLDGGFGPEWPSPSGLLTHLKNSGAYNHEELVYEATCVLTGSHHNTANMIQMAVACMLHHPQQVELLKKQPQLARVAVEETLRLFPPMRLLLRINESGCPVHNRPSAKGDGVLLDIVAANRHSRFGHDAHRFNVLRDYEYVAPHTMGWRHCTTRCAITHHALT